MNFDYAEGSQKRMDEDKVLSSIERMRDTMLEKFFVLSGAVKRLTDDALDHGQRLSELERDRDNRTTVPPEVTEVLKELRDQRAHAAVRSQLRLETEAEQAREIEAHARRRVWITWFLASLFAAAQVAQLIKSLSH